MEPKTMRSTWERYAMGWSNVGTDERQRLLRDTVAPACVYTDPVARCQGHAELAGVMRKFQGDIPGVTIEVEAFTGHGEYALVHWRARDAGGVARLSGADAVVFGADGLMSQIIGFFELPSAA